MSVTPDTTVGETLDRMVQRGVGSAIVLDGGKVVGIYAERDTLIKRLYNGKNRHEPVKEFMPPDPDCLTPDDSIAFALNRMLQGGYRHIPLVAPDRTQIGHLVMRDVVAYIASHFPEEVINLPPQSEHNPPDRSVVGG